MKIKKFNIYLADLNPQLGTEPGKIRPVVVVQTDLLNHVHPRTIICPLTSKPTRNAQILRVAVSQKNSGLKTDSDILVDRIRAVDNRRFLKKAGRLNMKQQNQLTENLRILILE